MHTIRTTCKHPAPILGPNGRKSIRRRRVGSYRSEVEGQDFRNSFQPRSQMWFHSEIMIPFKQWETTEKSHYVTVKKCLDYPALAVT